MNLRQVVIQAALGLTLFSLAAQARYVFVLPASSASSPMLTGYTDQLQPMGSVSITSGASQVFTDTTGTKAIVVAQSSTAAVSFISIADSKFSGGVYKTLSLDGYTPLSAVMTPDGQHLVVITGTYPGKVYIVNVTDETYTSASLDAIPTDLVTTQDSAYALVLGSTTVTYVNLSTLATTTVALDGVLSGSAHISMAPTGFPYVTARNLLIELSPTPSTTERSRTALNFQPGKMTFSPNGRWAFAPNLLLNTYSILEFDMGQSARTKDTLAGKYQQGLAIPSSGNALLVDKLTPLTSSAAFAWGANLGTMYAVAYPTLTKAALSLTGVGIPENVTSVALTNELPTTKYLYYTSNGHLYWHDIALNAALGNVSVNDGTVVFAAKPSTSMTTSILAYNSGQTLSPSKVATPYYVRALDANGQPVMGATVTFSTTSPGAALSATTMTTNAEGYAWVTATSPATSGSFTVTAAIGSVTTDIVSTVTGTSEPGGDSGGPDTASTITKYSGDGQLVLIGFRGDDLKVKVVNSSGVAVENATVTWSENTGYITVEPSTVTDSSGIATSAMSAAAFAFSIGEGYRQFTVIATADGVGSVSFTVTVYPLINQEGVPSLYVVTPTLENRDMTLKLGTVYSAAITAKIVTSSVNGSSPGRGIPGVGLTVVSDNTDATAGPVVACVGTTALSDDTGAASCDLVATGKTGSTTFKVNIGSFLKPDVFTATVTAGDAIAPTIVSGNNQTGKVGSALTYPLVAKVTDSGGNVLVGTTVTWEVVTANSAILSTYTGTSDSSGKVSTNVTLGTLVGSYTVKVTANSKSTEFTFTVQSVASALSKVSGDSQTADLSSAFSLPLTVQATTSGGAAAAGVPITWAVTSGTATLSTTTSTTGSDGKAAVTVTAGATAGTITVTAAASGVSTVTFTLTAALPGPVLTTSSFKSFTSGVAGLTPGGLVTISGTNLTSAISGTVFGSTLLGQWPYALNNVTVELIQNGTSYWAPIYSITNDGNGQTVVIQVPYELVAGTVTAKVTGTGSVTTTVAGVAVKAYMPGILETTISSRTVALATRADGTRVTSSNPAKLGEQVRIYLTGLGQTSPGAATNTFPSADQLVQANIIVGLDNRGYDVTKASLVQNSIGIYEVIFTMPTDVTTGSYQPIVILLQDAEGNSYYSNASVIAISN